MIGKQIRSLRHLSKNLNFNEPKKMVVSNGYNAIQGSVIKVKQDCKEYVLFFNNTRGDRDIHHRFSAKEGVQDLIDKYHYSLLLNTENQQFYSKRIIVPDNIDEMFSEFKDNNKKLFANVLNESNCNDAIPLYLYLFFHETPNLYAWAVKNVYKIGVSIGSVETIFDWSTNYSQLVKKLKKGTITAYNKQRDIISMYNEMIVLRRAKRANDVINTFNTTQKKLLKSIELDEKTTFILNRFSTLSDTKKRNFIRKMSTIDDASEILKQMSFAINLHFDWNRESLIEFIKNSESLNCDIIYDNNNIVIVRCKDYETIKHLGKTTNWCISKNKSYWNNYMSNGTSKQYVMFNFNQKEDTEESIIGFTSNHDVTISHAHSFTNENLMKGQGGMNIGDMVSFIQLNGDIMDILEKNNISVESLFGTEKEKPYQWNKESVIQYMNNVIGDDNYDILLDENDKFVVVSKGINIGKLLTNESLYINNLSRFCQNKHILFFDFSKNEKDANRLMFAIVMNSRFSLEEFVNTVYNINCTIINKSFDSLLFKFGLPYDIICRVETNSLKLRNAICNYDMEILDLLLKDSNIVKMMKARNYGEKMSYEDFHDRLFMSIFDANTFDFVNTLYNNGLKLQDVLKKGDVHHIVGNLIDFICSFGQGKLPTAEEIESFYDGSMTNNNKRKFVGYYMLFDKFIANETNVNMCVCLSYVKIHRIAFDSQFTSYLYENLFDKVDFSKKNEISSFVFHQIIENKNIDYINKIKKLKNLHKYFVDTLESSISYA